MLFSVFSPFTRKLNQTSEMSTLTANATELIVLLPCSLLILGSAYPLSRCFFSPSAWLVFYLMIYVSFAVSCSTHSRVKRAEFELKMDDYKSQGNTLNETVSCRDGM